jgi:hypothetical protein
MTGVVIFTAGRDDAYEDYQRSVDQGHDVEAVAEYLPADLVDTLRETSEDDVVRLWGTSVENKWRKVEPGDIALVYREGGFIAQASVLATHDDPELAEALWDIEGNPWDSENPWRYLTFLTEVESIDIDVRAFNELVGYEPGYTPQGFTRVADKRLRALEADSVETAIAELTGEGPRVHDVDEDEEDVQEDLGTALVEVSSDGSRHIDFEELVATAFTRLGCEARWIEGGDDTDVEVTAPVHAIVEAKTRGDGSLSRVDATRVNRHRERRGADHAIVVAPGFAPATIADAEDAGLALLPAQQLQSLLDRREELGLRPELLFEYLLEPGAFQDDRLDQLDEALDERRAAATDLVSIVRGLAQANGAVQDAQKLRYVLIGMHGGEVPDVETIEQSLALLSHPSLGVVVEGERGYELTTSAENAIAVLEAFGGLIGNVAGRSTR